MNELNHYQTLRCSFSAVSTPIFATKYSLELGSIRLKALAEIYTMHSFAPFWNRIPKTRKTMGRKEPGPTPGKNGQEKLISSRSSLLSTISARALRSVYEYEPKY